MPTHIERKTRRVMPNMETKQDVVAYFTDKKERSTKEGGIYHEAVVEILDILNSTDDISAIKSKLRSLHRAKLAEIQRTPDAETRAEQRKQLGAYDDCLTQLRGIPIS